jgi:hypothetical protein
MDRGIVRRPKGEQKGHGCMLVGLANSTRETLDQYRWLDKVPLVDSSTGQIWILLCKYRDELTKCIGINKWRSQIAGVPAEKEIWDAISARTPGRTPPSGFADT